MVVSVKWDTDGTPIQYLGLPILVTIPSAIVIENVADYLSDTYGFCVESFSLISK